MAIGGQKRWQLQKLNFLVIKMAVFATWKFRIESKAQPSLHIFRFDILFEVKGISKKIIPLFYKEISL